VHRPVAVLTVLALSSCSKDPPPPAEAKVTTTAKVAGIEPDVWKCDVVATTDTLAAMLGGAVHALDSAIAPPHGVPHPCNYVVDTTPQQSWTFDVYCRDDYKQQADALFAQYRADSDDLTTRFDAAAKAGALKNDAGVTYLPPERAADVAVGAKGLDHHGRGLIFIDDDAPCFVRVVGLDPGKRLDLARLIATTLTYANAPMTPRPAK
jgi:hypothetical protein